MNDRFSADDLPMGGARQWPHAARPIDLAHVRPFRIGSVEVRPATREVLGGHHRAVLEPRVMQVLIALASARGEILSRDDLIAACWEGRAVSDDAINRVLSRLRALSRTFDTLQVETIVKVGYRLIGQAGEDFLLEPSPSEPASSPSAIGRRKLIGGAAAATALAVSGLVLLERPWRHRPSAEALELVQRGEAAEKQGLPDQARQAVTFYEQAVRIDPNFADAWGMLARAYSHMLEGYGEVELDSLPGRIRSAAGRALELDSDNADAQLALILIDPYFHNWAVMEARLRRLNERYPRHWLIKGRLADLLYDVGRVREAAELQAKVIEIDPTLPIGYALLIRELASLGRVDEADARLKEALDRWPAHPSLWNVKYNFLLFEGRPEAAAAFVMDPDSRPSGFGSAQIDPRIRLARAVELRRPADIEVSVQDFTRQAIGDVTDIPFCASVFALLGRDDLAFSALERYYFDQGQFGPPAKLRVLSRRYLGALFTPPFAPFRSDPQFAGILRRTGLETYWRDTRAVPDFRRA